MAVGNVSLIGDRQGGPQPSMYGSTVGPSAPVPANNLVGNENNTMQMLSLMKMMQEMNKKDGGKGGLFGGMKPTAGSGSGAVGYAGGGGADSLAGLPANF